MIPNNTNMFYSLKITPSDSYPCPLNCNADKGNGKCEVFISLDLIFRIKYVCALKVFSMKIARFWLSKSTSIKNRTLSFRKASLPTFTFNQKTSLIMILYWVFRLTRALVGSTWGSNWKVRGQQLCRINSIMMIVD